MNKRILAVFAIALTMLPIYGCATIMKGGDQDMLVASDPKGATVSVYDARGMLIAGGKTPVTLPLAKGDGFFKPAKYRMVFEAPGYDPKEIWISGTLEAGWYLVGNFIVGGFIGWLVVDPITGAMWNLKPSSVMATLDRSLGLAPDSNLRVVLSSEVSPDLLALATPISGRW